MLGLVEGKVGPLPEEAKQQFRAVSDSTKMGTALPDTAP